MNTVFISSIKNDGAILSDDSLILNNEDIQRVKSPISNTSAINFNSMINNTSGSSSSDDTNTIFSDAVSLSTNERCGSTNTIVSTEDNINSKLSNYLNIPRDDYPIKDNDFLNHINPFPSKPPSYTKMNPNRLIRYPIYENIKPCSINEKPPVYSPTVENFTIVSIKPEYLSPYEPCNSKIWKNFIMEINSTQLNFYYIDSSLTHRIKNYSSGCDSNTNGLYHLDNSARAKFFNFNHKTTYNFNKYDQEHICYQIQKSKKKFLCQERLYKSFSLQFAKFGIPIDYNKKTFVLRMRCESEQFLINFAHVDDMINWTTYLSMGISVSLDLELREMPDYRIVPRRRRRRRRRRRHSHHRRHGFVTSSSSSNSRSRSHSNSFSSRRTRDIMSSHLSESALGALTESVSRKNSVSNSRKNSNMSTTSSTTQSLDQSFSSMSIDVTSRNSTNNRNSSRRCSSINLQGSPYNIISNSKSNSSSGTNLKSKLKGLFKIGYTPQKSTTTSNNTPVIPINIPSSPGSRSRSGSATNSTTTNAMSFISVSPTTTAPSSPVMRSNSFKNNYSTATSLNSLIEDEDENDESLPGGMQFSRKQDPAVRSISSSPLYQAAHMKVPQYICPKDTATASCASNPTHRLVQRNSIILQHELDELHEVLREHQDSDMEEDGDEDEDEDEIEDDAFDEMQHRNTSVITSSSSSSSSSYNRMNSVYSDEGIFHDSDTEEQDYYPHFRNRASSLMSSLSYGVGNDEVKWHPPICESSRKRYIRNSLRCIRPFLEDNEWVGCVCFKPTRFPPYETNNRPINYNGKECASKNRKNSNNSHHVQDYTNVKNHYLESFVVGPVDFIKADTPTIRRINKIKTKKNKDDDVESRLLLAYGS